MDGSILEDVKHKIGPSGDYDYYDRDIIDAINTAFGILEQLGVGPAGGFSIEDTSATWDSYIADDTTMLNMVKTYIYNKVRLIFDPPTNSFLISAIKEQNDELEWRMNVQAHTYEEE